VSSVNKATPGLTTGEQLNFLLINRLPRRWLTLFMGWFSRIESPALVWLFVGLGAVVFRTVHLFKLMGVQSGLVWMTKIFTDPFHDIKIYQKSPYYILRGEMYDTMENWYDDAPLNPRT